MISLRSLRVRLAAAAAASILAAVAVFAVVTVLVVGHELRSALDQALRQRAQVVAQLAVSAPSVLQDPGALESPASGRQLAVEVLDSRGRIVARSLTLQARLLPEDAAARAAIASGRTGFEEIHLDGRPWRMFVAPIAQAFGPASGGAVLVAAQTSDIAHTLSRLGVVVALSGVAIVVLATLAAALLTSRGLAPLRRLADAAGEIERTADPAQRLPESRATDEIGQLTGVLNRMLASLEQARAAERRLLADASHELRTPVTALLGNVEYGARHGADSELLEELRLDATRLARLVDDLLALERAEVTDPGHEAVDLGAVARAAAAEHDGGRVSVSVPAAVNVTGDGDALRRAISNLIENGLVHGPPGGAVTVRVERAGALARVKVSDAGPGPDPELGERLFERFWRGPDASERPGSGLGLSIVAAIAASHRGRARVQGSTFVLELPADSHPSLSDL